MAPPVQWLRDGLKIIRASSEVEALAAEAPDNGGVYLVPAFAGLGVPHWDAYARGAIVGLTRAELTFSCKALGVPQNWINVNPGTWEGEEA